MNHINTLNGLSHLSAVVENNEGRMDEISQIYPKLQKYKDIHEAIKDDFDGFVIATPAQTHFEIAKLLLENKNHILVEKPLSLNIHDAETLVLLADKYKVNLMVGHVLLFHPAIIKIKELIESGKIGKLQYIYSNRLNLGNVRTEENVFWSFAPHDISIFQYLIIDQPEEISIIYFVSQIAEATNVSVEIKKMPLPEHDPKVRRPDISRRIELLGWEPNVNLS